MSEAEWILVGIVIGVLLGIPIGYLLAKHSETQRQGLMLDRDQEGRITAIYYVPTPG